MEVLFWGTLLWVLSFSIQFMIWKLYLPQRQTRALLLIFFGVLVSGCAALAAMPDISIWGVAKPGNWGMFADIALLFTSFTLAYMITYSALEADSPSLVMVLKVNQAGEAGLSKSVFHEQMNDALLVDPRLRDLVTDKMVVQVEDGYRLTDKGRTMARLFIGYRRLLKLDKGG